MKAIFVMFCMFIQVNLIASDSIYEEMLRNTLGDKFQIEEKSENKKNVIPKNNKISSDEIMANIYNVLDNAKSEFLYNGDIGYKTAMQLITKTVEQGFNVNTKYSKTGETILHWALSTGSDEIVSYLLSKGANVNSTDNYGETPLFKGTKCDHENSNYSAIKLILLKGAKPNIRNNDGETALNFINPDVKTAKLVRQFGGKRNVNVMEFIESCQNGDNEGILDYISSGGNVNQNYDGITALMFSCATGNYFAVETLISAGAKLNSIDKRKMSALHWAVLKKHKNIAELLIKKGINKNLKDNKGNTAGYYYYWAVSKDAKFASKLGYSVPLNKQQEEAKAKKAFQESILAFSNVSKSIFSQNLNTNSQNSNSLSSKITSKPSIQSDIIRTSNIKVDKPAPATVRLAVKAVKAKENAWKQKTETDGAKNKNPDFYVVKEETHSSAISQQARNLGVREIDFHVYHKKSLGSLNKYDWYYYNQNYQRGKVVWGPGLYSNAKIKADYLRAIGK